MTLFPIVNTGNVWALGPMYWLSNPQILGAVNKQQNDWIWISGA